MIFSFRFSAVAVVGLTFFASAQAAEPIAADVARHRTAVAPLLQKFCVDCHGPDAQEGDVRLDNINGDLLAGKDHSLWADVLHRLETGEMPPKDAAQPPVAARDAATAWIRAELLKRHTLRDGLPGRVLMRRLSRNEYRNTLRDLLGLPTDLGRSLPPDTRYHNFDHVAESQELSREQLETYLALAREAISLALVPEKRPLSFQYRSQPELGKEGLEWRIFTHGAERADDFKKLADSISNARLKPTKPNHWHSGYGFDMRTTANLEGAAPTKTGVWLQAPRRPFEAKGADWGILSYKLPNFSPTDGFYRLRIKAGANLKPGLGTPLLTIHVAKKLLADIEIDAPAEEPAWYEWVFRLDDLQEVQIHSADNRFAKTPVTDIVLNNGYEHAGTNNGSKGWVVASEVELPGILIDAVELETNFAAAWPPEYHGRVLFDSPNRDKPEVYAGEVLRMFMSRAYRRPVREEELDGKLNLFKKVFAETDDFNIAIAEPLVATLVSPQFLFIAESVPPEQRRRPLDNFELAARLSYFLWSNMPDNELFSVAVRGELTQPEVLKKQVNRMLDDPRAAAFRAGFVSQWLGLDKLDELMVDDDRWVTRTGLRNAMKAEPVEFFGELLRTDGSLLNFIDSDFTMLNERLAQHYGIAGVYGQKFRKVPLAAESQRGGLLTQAACLTITTDGMITSPIYRGKWIMETILDCPPPPPPANVPPLDDAPTVRLSLREQLAKHREDASCNACHQKIDPVGWPLEKYSVLGEFSHFGWGENWADFRDKDGKPKKGNPPDMHGDLPDGTRVASPAELKQALLKNYRTDVLRSVTRHMLIYALGRPLDLTDDEPVKKIVASLDAGNLGARQLVWEIVNSEPFLQK